VWLRPLYHVAVLFGALPSCTEGFTSGDPASPQDAEARAAFSLLSLLPSRAPSLFSLLASACCLPLVLFRSLASFAVLAAVVSFGLLFGPRCVASCCGCWCGFWFLVVCSCLPCLLSFCWWFGGLIGCLLTEVTKDY